MAEMKKLVIGNNEYEVVDEKAREDILGIGLPYNIINTEGEDFNTYTKSGWYVNSKVGTLNNPINSTCILHVQELNGNRCLQTVIGLSNGKQFFRYCNTTKDWTGWAEVVSSSTFNTFAKEYHKTLYYAIIDDATKDFNDIKTNGYYTITSLNNPNNPLVAFTTNNRCILHVQQVHSYRYIQLVYSLPSSNTIRQFFRTGQAASGVTTWNEWAEVVHSSNFESYLDKWGRGKKIVNIGDSLFGNYDTNSISAELGTLSGATVYNCGFGGTRAVAREATGSNATFSPFDFQNLAQAICTGVWTTQDAQIGGEETPSTYSTRLETIKNVDFNTVDILTIAYGTNDWAVGYWGGTPPPLTAESGISVIRALREGISLINQTYPHIKIVLITPIWRYWYESDSDTTSYGTGTLEEFATAYEALAKELKIPFIDSYHNLTFNENNRTIFYAETAESSTHLNAKGRKMYAELIDGRLKTIF